MHADIGCVSRACLILRGWCYFHLNRYDESKQVFTAAAATGRADAASALVAVQQATKSH